MAKISAVSRCLQWLTFLLEINSDTVAVLAVLPRYPSFPEKARLRVPNLLGPPTYVHPTHRNQKFCVVIQLDEREIFKGSTAPSSVVAENFCDSNADA